MGTKQRVDYTLALDQIDATRVADVGGKGAHLGELARVEGVCVAEGFCVTTGAFARVAAEQPAIAAALDRLAAGPARATARTLAAAARAAIEQATVPDDVAAQIADALVALGDGAACAVRSSATAEDSATASFAGQHDTFLNVAGATEVLRHVRRCWASLFTDRAVAYRLRNGVDHRQVGMAVVVQRMVVARASGVLFTADPVTAHRRVVTVEASVGLGEALVGGHVDPDVFRVRDGELVSRSIAAKAVAVEPSPGGGTRTRPIDDADREQPALTDAQAVALAGVGRRVEAHFGRPQDIEWCLADDGVVLVQTRPMTTVFPVPVIDDAQPHVYLSVGHQQMMTDAMKPLGISVFQMRALPTMHEAGGRLFVDVAGRLAAPSSRAGLLGMIEASDPLTGDALRSLVDRDDVLPVLGEEEALASGPPPRDESGDLDADPEIVAELVAEREASVAALRRDIADVSGPALFDFIAEDTRKTADLLFGPVSHRVIMAGMNAAAWVNEHVEAWLGEKNVADVLSQSVAHNVTSEMGLALLDVADVIRPHPEVVAFLERVEHDDFFDELATLPGGPQARAAIEGYLEAYGVRCVGEIDITRPRWGEHPAALLGLLLGNVRTFEPGAARRQFERGERAARAKRDDVLTRLRALPDGAANADEASRMIDRIRTFAGYREYPKYFIVCRFDAYKQALLAEADRLVERGVLGEREDCFLLTFDEFHEAVRADAVDDALIARRRAAFVENQSLTPPRVMTSDGEIVPGRYRRDGVPPGALIGLGVSGGTVEGRARVIGDIGDAEPDPGDILVTTYTDPSWSPVFPTVAGLVTEVGGLMTHGAVIAREYGLPAVVGVRDATELIRDGQRLRVHGTEGYVEILEA